MFQCNSENVGVAWGQGYPLYSYHSYLGPTIYRGKSSEIRPPSIMAKAVFPIVAAIEGLQYRCFKECIERNTQVGQCAILAVYLHPVWVGSYVDIYCYIPSTHTIMLLLYTTEP